MQMYAKGMSQRDIEDTLKQIYGTEISQGLVSRITDKILPEVNEWQNRPLEAIYPVVFFDGIRTHQSPAPASTPSNRKTTADIV